MFSPKPPALSGRYAQYLTQRTRLSRISQVKSHPPLFHGLYPAFYLLEIHAHPLHPRSGHSTVKAMAAGGSQSCCQWRHWCVLLPSHSQVLTTCLMAETLLLCHELMLTSTEFPQFLLLFPSVPYWDTPSPLYWQWFSSLLLVECLQLLPPRPSLLLTLPWSVPYLTTTFLPLPIWVHNFPNGTLSIALRTRQVV